MDGCGPTVRGAGSPRGVSARAPPPDALGLLVTTPARHQAHLRSQPRTAGMVLHHVPQPPGFVPPGKSCPWGNVPPESPGGEHRGPTQLKGLEVALERVRLVGKPAGAGHSTRTCKLHPQDFETCESVYFIGWRWKNKAPAEAVE